MTCFKKLSGMKINFNKSDLTSINLDEEDCRSYTQIYACYFQRNILATLVSVATT
jgi:hypothetical protein